METQKTEGPDGDFLKARNAAQRFARWPSENKQSVTYQRVGKAEKILDSEGKPLLDNFRNETWGFPVEYEGSEGIKLFKVSVTNKIGQDVIEAAPTIQSRFKVTCIVTKDKKKEYLVEAA